MLYKDKIVIVHKDGKVKQKTTKIAFDNMIGKEDWSILELKPIVKKVVKPKPKPKPKAKAKKTTKKPTKKKAKK